MTAPAPNTASPASQQNTLQTAASQSLPRALSEQATGWLPARGNTVTTGGAPNALMSILTGGTGQRPAASAQTTQHAAALPQDSTRPPSEAHEAAFPGALAQSHVPDWWPLYMAAGPRPNGFAPASATALQTQPPLATDAGQKSDPGGSSGAGIPSVQHLVGYLQSWYVRVYLLY